MSRTTVVRTMILPVAAAALMLTTACQVKTSADTEDQVSKDPVFKEEQYNQDLQSVKAAQASLEGVGLKFRKTVGTDGLMYEGFDPNFYADFRERQNPDPTNEEVVQILTDEIDALELYEIPAKRFVRKYPPSINLQKADGSVRPAPTQATDRATVQRRLSIVGKVKQSRADTLEKMQKPQP